MHRGHGFIFICSLFSLCLHLSVQAQATRAWPLHTNYIARNIDNTNGLDCNDVLAIIQDHRGYIWIGTKTGLQRYDGLRFINCFDSTVNPRELIVSNLYPDDGHARVLYGQPDGRLREWGFLHHAPMEITRQSAPGQDLIYRDEQNKQWLFRIIWVDSGKKDSSGLVLVREPGQELEKQGYFITDKTHHQTWLLYPGRGLLLWDNIQKMLLPLPFPVNPITIQGMMTDSHGNLWLNSWSFEFYRYHLPTQKLHAYSLADILMQEGNKNTLPVWISSFLEDNHGVLWIGTGQAGLLQYDYAADGFRFLLRQPGNNLHLQYTDQINTIFQDKEENIWFGSDKGISIINPYRRYFNVLSNQDTTDPSKVVSDIVPAALIKGQLWTGSWGGGIKIYDTAHHLKKHFFFKGKYEQNMIWCFLEQAGDSVWAGCQQGLLHIIAPDGRVRSIQPAETEGRTIKVMVKDKTGNTLLGLHSGKIIVYDAALNVFLPYNMSSQPSSYRLAPIESLFVDDQGVCWAGTTLGLAEFDSRKRTFVACHTPHKGVGVRCWGVYPYQDSLLIVGTENDGIYFFHRRKKTFSRIPVNEEQSHWSVHAITVDSLGKIWFTTDFTICCYDPQTKKCFVSQPETGLIKSSFQSAYFITPSNGRWMTCTSTEVVGFYAHQLWALHQKTAPVNITGFKVFTRPFFIDSTLSRREPVRLSYKQNFISIEFSNLAFSGILRTKYFYRLEGVDPDWVYGGSRGYANYTNLPPGRYTFRVRTENALNNEGAAAFQISIIAPYWATLWFRVLVITATVLFLLLLVRRHYRTLRIEADMKQQIANTEMMALRAQMNPHFIFNCINCIDALIQNNDKYLATMYLNKFARLIRSILDSSRQNTIPLTRDLEMLQLYIDMEQFRNEDKFMAEICVDEGLLEEDCRIPPLIIQPYVENAILHGLRPRQDSAGRLSIRISREGEHLVYRIEDNGIGRAATAQKASHRSYGMEISRDRVNLFNKQEHIPVVITDLHQDGRPAGTCVQVSLKIS
ncbi:MAG: histidine kinase [Chitinophagaceae bacterium]|nr:histidine kinase [Chitinophagaceae bacterium]